jgi:RNA polymerase sigma-70 factor (ECF subfamily)
MAVEAHEKVKGLGRCRTWVRVDLVNVDDRRARFEASAPAVIEAVRRFLGRRTDPATAEDVLSETLLACWRRIEEMPADHLPWAYGVARLCLANADRGRRRRARLVARIWQLDPPPVVIDGPAPPDDDLGAALAALRPGDAELLRLWAWEDLAPGQIAVVLGISPNAAHIRLHRAKQRLRDQLNRAEGDELTQPPATARHATTGTTARDSGGTANRITPLRKKLRKTSTAAGHEETTEGRRP